MNTTVRRTGHGVEQCAHVSHVSGMRWVRYGYCRAQSIGKLFSDSTAFWRDPLFHFERAILVRDVQAVKRLTCGSFLSPATSRQLPSA